ncbi:hypothetical protein [Candidatus Mesenet endosymbiont of Phosphuga atrata]|uniref:hypothetical protein n=1 Tax=Candidatus Mesenet endosymbiont of Phosphuga atrata TaxID=3066221 RepID=UPI0030CD02CA
MWKRFKNFIFSLVRLLLFKDVLICGEIINELQVQNSVAKEDESHSITLNEGYGLSQATVSCRDSKGAELQSNL